MLNEIVFGYKVQKLLAERANCYTWLATSQENKQAVIKELRFGDKNSSWDAYELLKQEKDLLQRLKHSGIPRYITSFETDTSFCLVRKYVEGESLKERWLSQSESIGVAVGVLKILVYLQQQQPPIFHLNLNPDTIIQDKEGKVHLVGFGLVQTLGKEPGRSAITLNKALFIAPEQLTAPNTASDLYGLGNTLQQLILLQPSLNSAELDKDFQDWLERMSDSDLQVRYPDAETALDALQKSFWEEIETAVNNEASLSNKAYLLGVSSLSLLGIAIAKGYQRTAASHLSGIKIIVAIMAVGIIYLTHLAAATIITNEASEKKQALSFAVAVPFSLAMVTGFVWGKEEAVAVTEATVIAQTATLGTLLYSRLANCPESARVKTIGIVGAIAFGLVCGTLIF